MPADGSPGNSRPRTARQIDDDPDRVLTPTTIFAPGSLINQPDDGEGDRDDPHPFAGPGGAPPGYASFPGQDGWSGAGGFPPHGAFPGHGAEPGPGPAGFTGPGGFAVQSPVPPGGRPPGPGGFAANGAPASGAGYGAAGYPAPGYGPSRVDYPYPGPGAVPPADSPAAGYGPPPGQRYPGQHYPGRQFPGPAMPPGYAHDRGPDPRQQMPGWRSPDGFRSPGDVRGAGGQPYPGGPGPAVPGPGGYASPGYPAAGAFPGSAGSPPGHGYPGPGGQAGAHGGQNAFPGHPGYPVAGGFAGPGGPQAPYEENQYAEYQARRPHGAPGGYPEAGQYGEIFNGGDYAYVIREDGSAASPSRPYAGGQDADERFPAAAGPVPGRTTAAGSPARTDSAAGAGTPAGSSAGGIRAITSGAETVHAEGLSMASRSPASPRSAGAAPAGPVIPEGARPRPEPVPDLDPALHYGPDDPAYGPPGPDWYKRDEERTPRTDDAHPLTATGELRAARGPFEPLRSGDRGAADPADREPADAVAAFEDTELVPLESDISRHEAIDDDMPELLDFGTPTDPEAGALGELRDLYQTAETVTQASLDRHFDQLLERQRRLISEYFRESGGLGAAGAETQAAPGDSPVPFGFDTAESLASLRGELRSAQ